VVQSTAGHSRATREDSNPRPADARCPRQSDWAAAFRSAVRVRARPEAPTGL